ncbi:hypothetical protein DESA109040_13345 [Deinococcus saxicola]|uniref:hypothetical protein n=1 Tax=Deinococcus saxicola TaxID=249406 RepID=UPI0039EF73B0
MLPHFLLTVGLLGLGATSALTVWLPKQQQTATLTVNGLKTSDGRTLSVLPMYYYRSQAKTIPLSGSLFLRVNLATTTKPVQLVVEDAQEKPLATLNAPGDFVRVWPTGRGPCVTTTAGVAQTTRCWNLTLKTIWATFGGQPVYVSRLGDVAYTTPVPDGSQPYSSSVPIARLDLRTGKAAALTLDAIAAEPDPEYRRNVAEGYDARNTTHDWVALPGNRFLACVTTTLAKWGCRLDVLNRDAQFLYTLQGATNDLIPARSQDGRLLYAIGNTLQVWDAATGHRVRAIHDPLWEKQGQYAVNAFLTPDSREAVIIIGKDDQTGHPHELQAWHYALDTGKRLEILPLQDVD